LPTRSFYTPGAGSTMERSGKRTGEPNVVRCLVVATIARWWIAGGTSCGGCPPRGRGGFGEMAWGMAARGMGSGEGLATRGRWYPLR
jgi:hypothetical protein